MSACGSGQGDTTFPRTKIRARYRRLFALVADAVDTVDETVVYDNSRANPAFRVVARLGHGQVVGAPDWPSWARCPRFADTLTGLRPELDPRNGNGVEGGMCPNSRRGEGAGRHVYLAYPESEDAGWDDAEAWGNA